MSARRASSIVVVALALAACGGSGVPAPTLTSVTPARGPAATATPIRIHGSGFSVRTVQPAGGGSPSVDASFQAWMGDRVLEDVRQIDDATLSAIVPAGLTAGPQVLRVLGPFGTSGELASAFTVDAAASAALSVTVTAGPANVGVGQSISVSLAVANTGAGAAANVVPEAPTVTGTGTVGAATGPSPASIATLAPGETRGFDWSFPATGAGTLSFAGAASGTDAASGAATRGASDPLRPAQVTVGAATAATLAASIAALPASVNVGQPVTVELAVQNTGSGPAGNVIPDAPTVTGTGTVGAPTGPTPASIATLAAGGSGTFTWTYLATGAGALAFAGGARGTDALSGSTTRAVTDPTRPASVTVARPAALVAALPASGAIATGQEFSVVLTVTNGGGAALRDVVPTVPALAPSGLAALKPGTGPVPASVALLAAGASATFTWTCVAGATSGILRISAGASGTDANSGAAVASGIVTSGDFTIGAAGMVATLAAAPGTANAGQVVTLTLTVTNPGLAGVRDFAVGVPSVAPGNGAVATATAGPTPAPPVTLAAGQSLTTTWTYSPSLVAGGTSGRLDFVVAVTGVDAFSGGSLSAQPAASVTVQTPAAVTATGLTANPSTLVVGQAFAVTLTVGKVGTAPAQVTGTSLSGATCTTPPATPVEAAGALALTWGGCTAPATPQTLALSASATWVDANVPGVVQTTTPAVASVDVLVPASLAVTFVAQPPSPVRAGQAVTLTVDVRNAAAAGGESAVSVGVTPAATQPTGTAGGACGAATPALATIPAGITQPFTFACTPSGEGSLTFRAIAAGIGAVTGTGFSTEATTSPATTILPADSLVAAFAFAAPSPVSAGQSIPLTVTVENAGGSDALGVGVTPSFTVATGTAAAACGLVTPLQATIPAGARQDYVFACVPSGSGALAFGATAAGTAASNGGPLVATAASNTVTVQTPAVVTAVDLVTTPRTLRVSTSFSVTLSLARSGAAGATVTGVSLSGVNCTPPAFPVADIGTAENLTWTACAPLVTTDVVLVAATVTWVDVNAPGIPVTNAAFGVPIQAQ